MATHLSRRSLTLVSRVRPYPAALSAPAAADDQNRAAYENSDRDPAEQPAIGVATGVIEHDCAAHDRAGGGDFGA